MNIYNYTWLHVEPIDKPYTDGNGKVVQYHRYKQAYGEVLLDLCFGAKDKIPSVIFFKGKKAYMAYE